MNAEATGERMPLGARFEDAIVWAANIHARDVRKGTHIPYVSHLLAVCALVLEHGGGEDEAIGALLHDAIEDHPDEVKIADVEDRYGARVAEIVAGCTGRKDLPSWREQRVAYIAHLADASPGTLLVSYCDKLHNARAILRDYRSKGEELWRRFNAESRDDVLWYYRTLVDAFRDRDRDTSELEEVLEALERAITAR